MLDALNDVIIKDSSEPVPMPPEPELNPEDFIDANSWYDDGSIYVDPAEKYSAQDEPQDVSDEWIDDDGTISDAW